MLGNLTLGGDGAGDFPARRGCHRPKSSGILYPKRLGRLPPLDGDGRTCTTEPEETKHPVLQRRYLFSERSVVRGWQDSRAVHDSRGLCSEKSPFLARSSRGVSSNGGLRGFSDTWRAYLAKASSFRMHGARILPRTGDFPVRGHFRDAWSEKIATDCRPGTHRGGILPRQGTRERTARVYCHCQPGQERIRAQSCHRRTLRNASCEHFAIVERPGTHIRNVLPTERHLRAGGPIALP